VYGFYGRFYYAIPTDINVRDFGSELFVTTYNFDPLSTEHDPNAPGHPRPDQQGGAFNEPIDENIHGMYQDEFTIGVEKALAPGLLGRDQGHVPPARQRDRRPLRPRLQRAGQPRQLLREHQPRRRRPLGLGNFPWYDGYSLGGFHDAPAPQSPKAKRLYRAIELSARKSVGTWLWLQASYVYSSVRGNYDGPSTRARDRRTPA
jgi:hypothetical protein